MTPSLPDNIQHGCLTSLGSEQPSCFSCLIILGYNFQRICTTAHFGSSYKESVEFHLIYQHYGGWIWDVNHFSDQTTEVYVRFWEMKISFQSGIFFHGVKGSFSKPLLPLYDFVVNCDSTLMCSCCNICLSKWGVLVLISQVSFGDVVWIGFVTYLL